MIVGITGVGKGYSVLKRLYWYSIDKGRHFKVGQGSAGVHGLVVAGKYLILFVLAKAQRTLFQEGLCRSLTK